MDLKHVHFNRNSHKSNQYTNNSDITTNYRALRYLCEFCSLQWLTVTLQIYSGAKPERSLKVNGRFKLSAVPLQQVNEGNAVWQAISKKLDAALLSGE